MSAAQRAEIEAAVRRVEKIETATEPRFQVSANGVPFFGADIDQLTPGEAALTRG